MTPESPGARDAGVSVDFDPEAVAQSSPSRLAEIASAALTIATIVAIAIAAQRLSLHQILGLMPGFSVFWVIFVIYYFANPVCDWLIFRRLWNIGAEGFVALLRKYVINEVVLDYLGEAKFFAWARNRLNLDVSPFGAVKDVAILSAMASNVLTLLLLLAVWPIITSNAVGLDLRPIFLSLGVVLASSFAVLFFRGKLFSLPGKDLRFILMVHVVRTVGTLGLTAIMWHLVLPDVAIGSWLILVTLRMLVSRLPLVSNKDLFFSVVALYALGNQPELTGLLALMAGLTLTTHILVGAGCAIGELFSIRSRK